MFKKFWQKLTNPDDEEVDDEYAWDYLSQPSRPIEHKASYDTETPIERIMSDVIHRKKINAIKNYREVTGQGLKESKEVIEQVMAVYEREGEQTAVEHLQNVLQNRPRQTTTATVSDQLSHPHLTPAQLADIVRDLPHKKIRAIKTYRQFTGVGLKEAKEAVEAIMRQL